MLKKNKTMFLVCIILLLNLLEPLIGQAENQDTITINTENLNVREGPGLSYKILEKLEKDKTYIILKENNQWLQIQLDNGEKGWVAAWLVTKQSKNKQTSKSKTSTAQSTAKSIESGLRIRSGPGTGYSVLGTLNQGETVSVVNVQDDWIQVNSKFGTGWVSSIYLEMEETNPTSDSNTTSQEPSTVTVLHNRTNIRAASSLEAPIIQTANEGDSFNVTNKDNDWYEVQLTNGFKGYIAGWVVSIDETTSSKNNDNSASENALSNKIFLLDPGHGGKDSGTIGTRGTLEKKLTLRTAKLLYDKLTGAGAKVFFTRNGDQYIPLGSRVMSTNYFSADAFISIHYDSIQDQSISGMTSYYYAPFQKELALAIHNSTIKQTNIIDRGVRVGDYFVLRENSKKAVLLELGYLSNPSEELLVLSNQYQENVTNGIYQGILNYFTE